MGSAPALLGAAMGSIHRGRRVRAQPMVAMLAISASVCFAAAANSGLGPSPSSTCSKTSRKKADAMRCCFGSPILARAHRLNGADGPSGSPLRGGRRARGRCRSSFRRASSRASGGSRDAVRLAGGGGAGRGRVCSSGSPADAGTRCWSGKGPSGSSAARRQDKAADALSSSSVRGFRRVLTGSRTPDMVSWILYVRDAV